MTEIDRTSTTPVRDRRTPEADQNTTAPQPVQPKAAAEADTFQRGEEDRPRAPDAQPDPRLVVGQAQPPPPANAPMAPPEAIDNSSGTFELASRELSAGRGDRAAEVLRGGATELRRSANGAGESERLALNTLANNMDARANAYGEQSPQGLRQRAQDLVDASWEARRLSETFTQTNPELAQRLNDVGLDSRLQAETLFHAADNTDALLGQGVSQTYRQIVNASFDRAIENTGSINNFFTGRRDQLQRDRERVNRVFDTLDAKMAREGISFDRAWGDMFNNNYITSPDRPAGFATANDAATFLRDHDVTKGLLSPMGDLARSLSEGNLAGVDDARGDLVQALRTNGQWDIARNVLDDLQANARSREGEQRAQALNDSERREWWSQKAGEFVQNDLPVLLLSSAVSGGVGLGARALAGAAGWGTRAVRATQIAAEIGSFVPAERVLNDVINGRRADWSANGLARDYALTAGGYGLFSALGAGWRALRAPRAVGAESGEALALGGRPTRINPRDASENIRALTRENESAATLARNGYRVDQNPVIPGGNVQGVKHPDYRVGGEYFDNFAPTTGNARNIWGVVQNKVNTDQARRIVLNLDDSAVSLDALRQQFGRWPIQNLEQVLVVQNGRVFSLPLGRTPPSGPVPLGYPHEDN